jgi:hypothetical protein
VDTAGFNDQGWLDASGHTHSEALRVTEPEDEKSLAHLPAK